MFHGTIPVPHADCFRIENSGGRTFDEAAASLGGTDYVRSLLQNWGWQMNAYRIWACDGPPEGHAGWIEVSVHVFGSSSAAQQAVDFYATQRMGATNTYYVAAPDVGDYEVAIQGPTTNGTEFTIYSSHGPMMMRATGVSPNGVPVDDVTAVSKEIWAIQD
jgi:hypothetical protein